MTDAQLHIGILTGRTPYPIGMAEAQRIHLMARAMTEAGASVQVWVDGLDSWADARNHEASGTKDGVRFEFLLGRTQASSRKVRRIFDRFALAWTARTKMSRAARDNALDGLYFYTPMLKLDFERFIVRRMAQKNNVPIVIDLCEAPWNLKEKPTMVEKKISPLWGIDGVVCISRFLRDWIGKENIKTTRSVAVCEIPILVDIAEFEPVAAPLAGKSVLFAGSPVYNDTFSFLLEVMDSVWERHPDCQLFIAGGANESTPGFNLSRTNGRIRFVGYVERSVLLKEYASSSVLVLPMFDELYSHARFPTKLGEYLASGRPVVTNPVGEIPRFIEDGMSARLTPPGDITAFASAICGLLDDPAKATTLGANGRTIAEKNFHYSLYGPKLVDFFTSLNAEKTSR